MCFSARASFGAGIGLSVIGMLSLRKAKHYAHLMFASIPLMFAMQQLLEGVVWISFTHPAYSRWQDPATYAYLIFAQVIWPLWVPLAMLLLEKEKRRILILRVLAVTGLIVSIYLAFCLYSFNVHAAVINQHIAYYLDFPSLFNNPAGTMYILATVLPTLISGVKKMWTIGVSILLSCIITQLIYAEYLISIWCFFAAIISVLVFYVMQEMQKSEVKMDLKFS